MTNSLWSSLFGSAGSTQLNPAQQQQLNQQFNQAYSQLAQQSAQQSYQIYNQYAQQAMNQQYAAQQHRAYNMARDQWIDQRYMIDGKYMSLQEFVDFIWPEDCPEKTFFVLKHTKETGND